MMLEEDSWADAYDLGFHNACDKNSALGVSCLASENTRTLHQCFKHNNIDSIHSEFCQNGPISLADNDVNFFDNRVDKAANDLLYYNWSEMGNFEDVDMMFSRDSTFGLGAGNEDSLGWFSSSDSIRGSADGLRSDFKLQRTKETSSSVSDSGNTNQPVSYNRNLSPSQKDESPSLTHLSFVNASSNSECQVVPQQKITDVNEKHTDHENQLKGRKKGVYLESGDALQQSGIKVENNGDLEGIGMRIPAEFDSSIVLESSSICSGLDETAEEAAGFHQLQRVAEQLDIRTKLCMRDSLYRLARSAEQRHRDTNVSDDSGDDRDRNQASIRERTNKRKRYMDMESDTNTIDRSIAQLLFLKSSGSTVTPA